MFEKNKNIKIQITHWITGSVLFEYEAENNTIARTVREAYLHGANLSGADLSGADPERLPITYVNACSRDMLFIFEHLKGELPFLRKKLIDGEVDGTQYEGHCACLLGTLANADGGLEEVCAAIPFYDKGLHNPGENWFLNIHKGDTPENNVFAKHAVMLIDMVLNPEKKVVKKKQSKRKGRV
jgi:hypothetical protein